MAARKSVNITEEQYKEARAWLDEGGTKTKACAILGIAYNTKRLDKLMDEWETSKAAEKKLRAKKRKEAMPKEEIAEVVTGYLNGMSLKDLANYHYRSEAGIKGYLNRAGALLRNPGKVDPLNPYELPDECIADSFEVGQYVWSAAYNCVAQVKAIYKGAYRIQITSDNMQQSSYQPASELGCMKHLEALGVDLSRLENYMKGDDVKQKLYETMAKAKKNAR